MVRQEKSDSTSDRPISDYALIGDGHGAALVSRDGAVDWCALGRFDADPVCCRILDRQRGGFLSVVPLGRAQVSRSYVEGTNILQTVYATARGRLVISDFMPVGRRAGSGVHDYVHLAAPLWLVRLIEVVDGRVDVRLQYRPTTQFGLARPSLAFDGDVIAASGGPFLWHNVSGWTLSEAGAEARVTLAPGERRALILSAAPVSGDGLAAAQRHLAVTQAFWREWLAYCRYRGPYAKAVRRSLLAIKMLIYAPSGALVAAPTTSLPEQIGGTRNWDYRYCWLRDATYALYALAASGYGGEARRFSQYLPRVCAATAPDLRIMYGITGAADLPEKALDHLQGYAGSRPVRVGNDAHRQRQIDVYGEILDWALLFVSLGGRFDQDGRAMLRALADYVAAHWAEPDQGLWEMRRPALQHVHGKIMSWVALDRALRLLGPNETWARERDRIVHEVDARGRSPTNGHLVQAYDRPQMDAALLLVPMTGFPVDEPVLRHTIAAVEAELRSGDFVARYRTADGIAGGEGAFLMCSFWLVDAYLCLGRHGEAKALFERLLGCANDVGLYPEEIDPADGSFLGNFPQAYTHLALIGSAAHLQLYEQRGAGALRGTLADRARLMVSATLGWRAIWASFRATWRLGRVRSSRRSQLATPGTP